MNARIEDVSDTALLIAAARALENENPEGFVSDQFAARLAGERGMELINRTMTPQWMAYGIGLRTRFTDELVLRVINEGPVDAVLSLSAGLDTRPWRMELPRELRWIEVDAAATLEYKAGALADAEPRCRYEHLSADVNDPAQRRDLIARASEGSSRALLLTEGVVMYLPGNTVRALAAEAADAAFRAWIFALVSPELRRVAHGNEFDRIGSLQADSHLEGRELLDTLSGYGWQVVEHRSTVRDGWKVRPERFKRMMQASSAGNTQRSAAPPPSPDDVTGVWLCGHE